MVARVGNWRVNQHFLFFFALKIGQIHKGNEEPQSFMPGQSYQGSGLFFNIQNYMWVHGTCLWDSWIS